MVAACGPGGKRGRRTARGAHGVAGATARAPAAAGSGRASAAATRPSENVLKAPGLTLTTESTLDTTALAKRRPRVQFCSEDGET